MTPPTSRRLGLMAGGGPLPVRIAEQCERERRPLFVVRLKGFADDALSRFPGVEVTLGEWGRCLDALKRASVDTVCFCGTVNRPDFASLKPDLKGLTILPGLISAARKGDDALLRQVMGVFEGAGFDVVGADDVLGGDRLPSGALGQVSPDPGQHADVVKALHIAKAVGALDVGQGAVVCDGLVLAVEAQEGTDAMLERVATLPAELKGAPGAGRGVLAKAPKPIQERRMDLPVMGVTTIEAASRAGLAGVAGEADGVILMDREAMIAAADRLGLFIWGERA